MKVLLICALLVVALFSCQSNNERKTSDTAKTDSLVLLNGEMNFERKTIDFGTVKDDTLLVGKFEFRNTGKDPVKIINIQPDCHCTAFKASKKIVQPMDTASISLSVSTKNKMGTNELNSTVMANTQTKLYLLRLKFKIKKG